MSTMMSAQVDDKQVKTIMYYIEIGKKEDAQCLIGGNKANLPG